MVSFSRRILRRGVLALAVGLTLVGITSLRSNSPDGNSRGFPWRYAHAVSPCYNGNLFNGCGFTIDPNAISLNLVFCVVVGLAVSSGTRLAFLKWRPSATLQCKETGILSAGLP